MFATLWEKPKVAAILALSIYVLFAAIHNPHFHRTDVAYYNFLADAFLHGQLHLRVIPDSTLDLSVYDGRFYLYWPPFPTVLMMPFVALFGIGFSDVIFTLVIAAANVFLVAVLLRRLSAARIARTSKTTRGLLVLFFALGTVHLTLAPFGRVWFTGQIIGFTCVLLAYLASLSIKGQSVFALTGLALAAAMLTRNHLVLTSVWPTIFLYRKYEDVDWGEKLRLGLWLATPIAIGVVLLALYNLGRFGSVLDNGIPHHAMHPAFVNNYQHYGMFSIHYLPTNVFYQYFAYPFPIRATSYLGGSLFLLSPVFVAAFRPIIRDRSWTSWSLLGTIALTATPILLLMGTGWVQFGPRYTLDFTVPLLILTAIGVRRWSIRTLAILTFVSVIQYLIGALSLAVSI